MYNDNNRYDKGYAVFDNGKLYAHFNGASNPRKRFGSADIGNAVECDSGDILKINTNQGITIYAISGGIYGASLDIIGRRADGRYVKYADCLQIYKNYGGRFGDLYAKIESVSKDTILVGYYGGFHMLLKFQWDDKAQWFSVARIK